MAEIKFNFESSVRRLADKLSRYVASKEKGAKSKMTEAVNLVYKTATTKRPNVTYVNILGETQKVSGRVPKEIKRAFYTRTVSDPDAESGVPVKTGNLQSSIKKEVKVQGRNVVGRVYVDTKKAKYAKYVEFGTSKMQARPFMRPALDMNQEKIRKIFGEK